MELRHLRYFSAVVEAGSLTAAAAKLHMSQPPLSVAISQLEARLGVRLLVRSARGVEPTSAGRYLLDASSRLLGDVEDIVSDLTRFGTGAAGTLTIAVVPVLMWGWLPATLRKFAAVAPHVDVRLTDPPPWQAIDMLHERKSDLAAIVVDEADRFVARHKKDLRIIDLGPVPLVAALPPDEHDVAAPFPLIAFADRTLVLPRRVAAVPSLPDLVSDTLVLHDVSPKEIRTAETIQTALPLIEAGFASSILPDPERTSLSRFNVTVRELHPQPRQLRALALTRRSIHPHPVVEQFLDSLNPKGNHV